MSGRMLLEDGIAYSKRVVRYQDCSSFFNRSSKAPERQLPHHCTSVLRVGSIDRRRGPRDGSGHWDMSVASYSASVELNVNTVNRRRRFWPFWQAICDLAQAHRRTHLHCQINPIQSINPSIHQPFIISFLLLYFFPLPLSQVSVLHRSLSLVRFVDCRTNGIALAHHPSRCRFLAAAAAALRECRSSRISVGAYFDPSFSISLFILDTLIASSSPLPPHSRLAPAVSPSFLPSSTFVVVFFFLFFSFLRLFDLLAVGQLTTKDKCPPDLLLSTSTSS